jgi:hypothetical protein
MPFPFSLPGSLLSSGVLLALCACSSSSGGSSPSPSADGGAVTFTEVYDTVLQPTCSSHHAAGQPDSFLDMSTKSAAYASLVGVKASGPACGTSGETRVVAGNASDSLLFQKVSMSKPPCGAQMPFGATPISASEQTLIEDWINAGAKND